jgi:hypothetical protein
MMGFASTDTEDIIANFSISMVSYIESSVQRTSKEVFIWKEKMREYAFQIVASDDSDPWYKENFHASLEDALVVGLTSTPIPNPVPPIALSRVRTPSWVSPRAQPLSVGGSLCFIPGPAVKSKNHLTLWYGIKLVDTFSRSLTSTIAHYDFAAAAKIAWIFFFKFVPIDL